LYKESLDELEIKRLAVRQFEQDRYNKEAKIVRYKELKRELKVKLRIIKSVKSIQTGEGFASTEWKTMSFLMKYVALDREYSGERIRDLNAINNMIICICLKCRIKKAALLCSSCGEAYCNQCFDLAHRSAAFKEHQGYILYQKKELKKLNDFMGPDGRSGKKSNGDLKLDDIEISPMNYKAKILPLPVNVDHVWSWLKFESFAYQSNTETASGKLLQDFLQKLEVYYFNALDVPANTKVSMQATVLKGMEALSGDSKLSVEDKIWINRIYYMLLRKKAGKVTVADVTKTLVNLMVNHTPPDFA
jgi:hypothetical protein